MVKLNDKNTNRGTDRGRYMVRESIERVGPRRSAVADKDGVILAGNKTVEAAINAGIPLKVVPASPDELVVLQFDDLDIDGVGEDGEKARLYEIMDNRASQVGLEWDEEIIQQLYDDGLDLLLAFTELELFNEFDIEALETNDDLIAAFANPEPESDTASEPKSDTTSDGAVSHTTDKKATESKSRALVPRHAVPIVLTREQKAKWDEFKAHNKIRNDIKAFVYLLDLFFEPMEDVE